MPTYLLQVVLWKFQLSMHDTFLYIHVESSPPQPQEIPISSVGEYGYFLELLNIVMY